MGTSFELCTKRKLTFSEERSEVSSNETGESLENKLYYLAEPKILKFYGNKIHESSFRENLQILI